MRPINELINTEESSFPLIQKAVSDSKLANRILPVQKEAGEKALYNIQVTSRSPLGSITLHTGGILVDHGWLRILGGGYDRLIDIASLNGLQDANDDSETGGAFTIAYDVTGGLFALNGGALKGNLWEVCYFGADTLDWQQTGLSYSDFIQFALSNGGLKDFYSSLRWYGWEEEVENLYLDQTFTFMPPLWTVEGKDVNRSYHAPVPFKESLLEMDNFIDFSNRYES